MGFVPRFQGLERSLVGGGRCVRVGVYVYMHIYIYIYIFTSRYIYIYILVHTLHISMHDRGYRGMY